MRREKFKALGECRTRELRMSEKAYLLKQKFQTIRMIELSTKKGAKKPVKR